MDDTIFIPITLYASQYFNVLEDDLYHSIRDCLNERHLENVPEDMRFIFYIKEGAQHKIPVHTTDKGVLCFEVSKREKQLMDNLLTGFHKIESKPTYRHKNYGKESHAHYKMR